MKGIVIVFLIISNTILAQEEIVTDRPDVTESSLTIPFKALQIEAGTTFSSEQNIKSYSSPEYLIRVGIHKFLELRIENSLYKNEFVKGLNASDLFLGVKVQILKKEKFNIAFLSHISLPEGDRKDVFYVEKLLLSYAINENTELGINLGVDGVRGDGNGEFVYAVALGKGLTEKLGFFIENFGSISEKNGLNSVVDGGFSYLLKNKVQLDTKFGIDTQYFKNYFFGFGISARLFN